MVISTTLGVAQNHIFRTGRGNHSGRNLSGIGTRSLVGTVFRSNTDFFRIDSLSHRRKMYERRTDNHIAIYFFTSQSGFNTFCQCQTFLQGLIHFPVAGNDCLAVLLIHPVQKRRQLIIRIIFERFMQIERHNRRQKHMGQPACQQRRHQQRQQHDEHNPRRGG